MGIVLALMLFIIFFSAVVLYLAFRIKETFHQEGSRGALVVKITFLVGVLFLAGGSFYYFANLLSPPSNGEITPPNGAIELKLSMSYPSKVTNREIFTITFTIINPTEHTAHGVVIQTSGLFQTFQIVSSDHRINGNTIELGEVSPGTIISSLKLQAPTQPGNSQTTITLSYKEMTEPISEKIQILIKGGP